MKCKRKVFRDKEKLCKQFDIKHKSRFRGKMGKVRRIMPKGDWYNYVNEKILKPMINEMMEDR